MEITENLKKHVSVDDDEETTNIDLELSSIPTNPTNKKEISEFLNL